MIALISSLYIAFLLCWVKAQEGGFNHRFLGTCSSYTTCSSCLSDSNCSFLDNSCSGTSSSTVASDSYSFSTESVYCSNYSSSGSLTLGSSGSESLSLYQLPGTSISSHPTCYWRIENPSLKQVSIKFQRSISNYEDIYIEYSYNSKSYTLSTRDISSCSSTIVNLYLNGISSVFIKVKRVDSNSDYSITVTNTNNDNPTQFNWNILIGVLVTLFVFAVIGVVVVAILVCRHRRAQRYKEIPKHKEQNAKFVEETLSAMTSGEFRLCKPLYKQDNCVICLENLKEEDKIHITNECNHAFHSSCLKIWYLNTRSENLTCPHCHSENSPNSKPQPNSNQCLPSQKSVNDQLQVLYSERESLSNREFSSHMV